MTFEYNEDGLRTKKTSTSLGETVYTLHGKNVVHMTQGGHDLHFYYDAQGKPGIVLFDGTPYAYLYNLQGDVIALANASGAIVCSYGYDAWGVPVTRTGPMRGPGTVGFIQPFRYRGYVWDEETGLYYLRSRYYRPSWGRFVSADYVVKSNLFSYCSNTPVENTDLDGDWGIYGVSWPGEIHRQVQNHIAQVYTGIEIEVFVVQANGRSGRMDLYNPMTGEYWDIKTATPLDSIIDIQLDRYLSPKAIKSVEGDYSSLHRGTSIKPGCFVMTSSTGHAFKVAYYQTRPGVIRYLYRLADYDDSVVVAPEKEPVTETIYSTQTPLSLSISPATAIGLFALTTVAIAGGGFGALYCFGADDHSLNVAR